MIEFVVGFVIVVSVFALFIGMIYLDFKLQDNGTDIFELLIIVFGCGFALYMCYHLGAFVLEYFK